MSLKDAFLNDYIKNVTVFNGDNRPILEMQTNSKLSNGTWTNNVYLQRKISPIYWERVYQSTFTDPGDHTGNHGYWAGSIEYNFSGQPDCPNWSNQRIGMQNNMFETNNNWAEISSSNSCFRTVDTNRSNISIANSSGYHSWLAKSD